MHIFTSRQCKIRQIPKILNRQYFIANLIKISLNVCEIWMIAKREFNGIIHVQPSAFVINRKFPHFAQTKNFAAVELDL